MLIHKYNLPAKYELIKDHFETAISELFRTNMYMDELIDVMSCEEEQLWIHISADIEKLIDDIKNIEAKLITAEEVYYRSRKCFRDE